MMVHELRKSIQGKCAHTFGNDLVKMHECFRKETKKNQKEIFHGAFAEQADDEEDHQEDHNDDEWEDEIVKM